jgi:hypothetical protein
MSWGPYDLNGKVAIVTSGDRRTVVDGGRLLRYSTRAIPAV